MKSPQELIDENILYKEKAVILLDEYFGKEIEKSVSLTNSTLSNLLFDYSLTVGYDYTANDLNTYLFRYLNDEEIKQSFIESCKLSGWKVTIESSSNTHYLNFIANI